jgi:hypothetical protein
MAFLVDGHYVSRLAIFGGLLNPAAVAYLVFRIYDRAPGVRKALAVLVLCLVPITWFALSKMELGILIGHFVWILGLFLILVPMGTKWPSPHDFRWLAVPPALLLVWWGAREATTQKLQPATDRDVFIYQVALEFKAPGLCEKIPRFAAGNRSGNTPGYQMNYLQSDCYFTLASALHDLSLCDKVMPVSSGMHDGSSYTPKSCRENRRYDSVEIVDPHTISTWISRLGYTDPEFYQLTYLNGNESPVYNAYDRLKNDAGFKAKIAAAPSFEEPAEVSSLRAPNDLEYLYGTFAIDSNDPTVCAKISPNAAKLGYNPKLVSMRVECYHDLARNNRDARYCDNVPPSGRLPSGTEDNATRETCVRDVEIMKRDANSKLHFSPGFPPTFQSFVDALHRVGYEVDLPRPTYSDYEDFLIRLEHADPVDRAEFLRRVAALK